MTQRSQNSIVAEVVDELGVDLAAGVRKPNCCRARVVTEHRAVFSPRPGVDTLRPPQQSPIANLQLAGDWTDTGWPATMEGAVKSGFLAAENVLRRMGTPRTLVQSGLAPGLACASAVAAVKWLEQCRRCWSGESASGWR